MPQFSSDQLRDISVAVVEDFINNRVPLSEGLAKQASMNDLNSEQIQRCVEATNTITQLKLMSVAEDRTFEFPLCKYAEVMVHATFPELDKEAGFFDTVRSVGRTVGRAVTSTVKDATGTGAAATELKAARSGLEAAEKDVGLAAARRGTSGVTGTRDNLTDRIHSTMAKQDLHKAKSRLEGATKAEAEARSTATGRVALATGAGLGVGAAGTAGYESHKAHTKSASESLTDQEAKVFFIKEAAANELRLSELEARSLTLANDLVKLAAKVAKDQHGLDKIACVVDADIQSPITTLVYGEAKTVRDFGEAKAGLFKQAELADVSSLASLYKEATALVQELSGRRELQKKAAEVKDSLTKEAFFNTIGRVVGGTLGGVAGLGARSVMGGAKGAASVGKAVMGKKMPLLAATGGFIGGAVLDSSMVNHDPGVNKVTGTSKDVWNALQN
ncbi:MAG TPA: hypothetical protein VFM18_05270 [Methanosarcina sp.]|nr:hypothetical protein [Methanosarcina sp.]